MFTRVFCGRIMLHLKRQLYMRAPNGYMHLNPGFCASQSTVVVNSNRIITGRNRRIADRYIYKRMMHECAYFADDFHKFVYDICEKNVLHIRENNYYI